jgi:NADPH-dependent ferric siderophore reductase
MTITAPAPAPAPAVLPMVLTEAVVQRVEQLSSSFVRVELGSQDFADLGVDGPWLDQRIKLIFPGPSGRLPVFSTDASSWYADWMALPAEERGSMRTYTIREVRGSGADTRVVIDLVLHLADGATGPGSQWAAGARTGDRVGLVGPRRGFPFGGIEFDPRDAARILLVADETAVPAVAGILDALPADAAGTAYLEVPHGDDIQELTAPPGMRVVWLPREGEPHGQRLCRAVLALFGLEGGCDDATPVEVDPDLWETPTYSSSGEPVVAGSETAGGLYAWVAGESGSVTRLRRHLVRDAGLDRRQVAFMGYWRHGVAMKS